MAEPRFVRQLPGLTQDNRAFWTGGASGQLLITRCDDCGRFSHPPLPLCFECKSERVRPAPVSGRGKVYSFTVNRHAWRERMPVPFVFAMVELVEQNGLWLMTSIVNCPVESVHIGQPVRVVFERHDDVWLPLFEPDA